MLLHPLTDDTGVPDASLLEPSSPAAERPIGYWRRLSRRSRGALPVGSVGRGVAVVGVATAVGQGAIVLGAPVLARLYDPEGFGVLSVFVALLSVLLAVAAFRFDVAIPLAKDDDEAVHLLGVSAILSICTSAVVAVIVLVAGSDLFRLLGAPALSQFAWLLPLALLIAGLAQPLASWATYRRSFGALGRMRSLQGLVQVAAQAVLGLLHVGTAGLLIGDVLGRIAGLEQVGRSALSAIRSTTLSRRRFREAAADHWGFARVMTAASLLNALSLQVPFLLIPLLFDLASSGQYFLAHRVLVLPASLVAAAASQVFFGEAASRRNSPVELASLARNAAISLLIFSIPTYAIIMVAGPALIDAIFGSEWATAGLYAQISAPWLILWSVANPISAMLLVGRRERESLMFTAAELLLKAGALVTGAALHSLTAGIVILSIVSVGINIAALWRFLRVAGISVLVLVRPALRIALLSAVPVAVVAGAAVMARGAPVVLVGVAGAAWIVSIVAAARFSPEPRALLGASRD